MAGKNQVVLTFAGDASQLERTLRGLGVSVKKFETDADGTTSRLSKLTGASQGFASKLASFGKVAAIGLAGVGVAAVGMGISFAKAAEESQQVTRQTGAVIKSMGASAWTSAGQVAALSEKLSLQSGIDDELIQSGSNVLLTFANVRNEVGRGNDVFDRATTSALDMSVALGQDMQASVTQLGKALNDPIRGITALGRVGVQFTEQQKEQIKTLVESGDTLGAQKIILGEVEKQFAGSAAAQATASQKLATAWGNLQEELGAKLLPVFEAVSGWIVAVGLPALEDLSAWVQSEGVPRLKDFGGWLQDKVLPALQALGSFVIGTVVPALVALGAWFTDHQTVLAAAAIGITAMLVPAFVAWAIAAGAAAIATLVAAAPLLLIGAAVAAFAFLVITHWDTIKSATITAFEAVRGAVAAAFNWVKTNWPLLLAILTGPIGLAVLAIVKNWQTIKDGVTGVKNWIVGAFNSVVSFVAGLPGRIASAASGMWNGITGAFKSAINTIISLWNGLSFPSFTIPSADPLGSFGPSIGGGTIGGWNLPNIPMLHTGGEFRAPAGQREGLAMLLDGETVNRPGASPVPQVNIYIAGSLVAERDVVKAVRDELVRGGFQ